MLRRKKTIEVSLLPGFCEVPKHFKATARMNRILEERGQPFVDEVVTRCIVFAQHEEEEDLYLVTPNPDINFGAGVHGHVTFPLSGNDFLTRKSLRHSPVHVVSYEGHMEGAVEAVA